MQRDRRRVIETSMLVSVEIYQSVFLISPKHFQFGVFMWPHRAVCIVTLAGIFFFEEVSQISQETWYVNVLMTNSKSPIMYQCHIEKSKHFHFVSFNQDQGHIGILYVTLRVAFGLAMCWISLNLCPPEGCLPNLSLRLCLFSKDFALAFIEQHRKYHVGEGMRCVIEIFIRVLLAPTGSQLNR